jgi:hypothetical protein
MTGSTPADLAVAFRSLGRRLREALPPEGTEVQGEGTIAELRSVVDAAAAELGVPASPAGDLGATGTAIAAAIDRVPADAWEIARLNRLRELALDAGRLLRQIEQANR